MKSNPSLCVLPFKRIAFQHAGVICMYEAEDAFFKIKNFSTARQQDEIYFCENPKTHLFSPEYIRKLKLIEPCAKCEKQCPQIYSADGDKAFLNMDEEILKILRTLHGTILDVGFGDIVLKNILIEELKDNITYVGIEPDKGKYEKALKALSTIELHDTTLEAFDYKCNYFDFVLLLGSFNHIKALSKGLDVIRKILKDKGRLIIIENVLFGLLNNLDLYETRIRQPNYQHYRNSYMSNAVKLLENADFKIVYQKDKFRTGNHFWMMECEKQTGSTGAL